MNIEDKQNFTGLIFNDISINCPLKICKGT